MSWRVIALDGVDDIGGEGEACRPSGGVRRRRVAPPAQDCQDGRPEAAALDAHRLEAADGHRVRVTDQGQVVTGGDAVQLEDERPDRNRPPPAVGWFAWKASCGSYCAFTARRRRVVSSPKKLSSPPGRSVKFA